MRAICQDQIMEMSLGASEAALDRLAAGLEALAETCPPRPMDHAWPGGAVSPSAAPACCKACAAR